MIAYTFFLKTLDTEMWVHEQIYVCKCRQWLPWEGLGKRNGGGGDL